MILLWNSAEMLVHVTLVDAEGEQTNIEWLAERHLARDMLAYLRDLLATRRLTFTDITGIGVNRGPGSFTGLRIGLTVLNTIASTEHISIVGTTGENWREDCLTKLHEGANDQIVLPEYGGDAHITKPRK